MITARVANEEKDVEVQAVAKIVEIFKAEDAEWAAFWEKHGPAFVSPETGERTTEGIEANPEVENEARYRWEKRRRQELEVARVQTQGRGPITGIHEMLDLYLEAQKKRQQRTRLNPETLSRKQRLGLRGYQAIKYGIDAFREYTDERKLKKMPIDKQLEKLLYDYREYHNGQAGGWEVSERHGIGKSSAPSTIV